MMYFIDVSQDSEIHKITDLPIKSAVIKIDNDEQQIHNSCTGNKIRQVSSESRAHSQALEVLAVVSLDDCTVKQIIKLKGTFHFIFIVNL